MARLTKTLVVETELPKNGKQAFLWDSEVKGFGLRLTSESKSYVLQYRTPEGRSRRITIGRHGSPWTCDQARTRALEMLRQIADGKDPLDAKAEARAALTVKELAELYLEEGPAEKPNKKLTSWKQDRSQINRHVIPLMGKRFAKELTAAEIARFQMDVANGKSAADIKTGKRGRAIVEGGKTVAGRCVAVLGALLAFGVSRKLITENPAKGVKLFKPSSKERFLSEREVMALAEALAVKQEERSINDAMADAIRVLMLTGCRKNEILGLKWEWVDFDHRCLRLPDSKTGAKVVLLATQALQILSVRSAARAELEKEKRSDFVFPAARGKGHAVGLQKAWENLRTRATEIARQHADDADEPIDNAPNFTGVRIHDLRHSFASFAIGSGESLFITGKALGHSKAETTQRYAHLADSPLRAVADRTASKIADAMKVGVDRDRPKAEVVTLSEARRKRRAS